MAQTSTAESERVCLLSHGLASASAHPYGRIMTSDATRVVRISATHNRVEVFAASGSAVRVDGSAEVSESDGQVTVSNVTSRLAVFVDAGTDLVIGTTNGRVAVKGPAGQVSIVTESGRVGVEEAASVDIRSGSSRVEVGSVTGTCRIRSTSGRVDVGSCGVADIASNSGRIEMHKVNGEVAAHSVSGRIELSMETANDVRAETVTGRIEVSLPNGTVAYQPPGSALGTLRPPGCDCTVVARSTTGKVVVTSR
jgi:hypothetical protein